MRKTVAVIATTIALLVGGASLSEAAPPMKNYWKVKRCLLPEGCLNPGGVIVPPGHPMMGKAGSR